MSVAIALHEVEKTFPNGVQAVAPTDLRIQAGEFTTILGPSGCGKSTVLRMIAGLTTPTGGSIEHQSKASNTDPAVAFVFQSPTLMPWATVARNVRLPLELRGLPHTAEDVDTALAQVGLLEFRNAYPRELSGGMQMRVSIARALVTRPRLLLMDEPFGALDEITRNRLDRDLHSLWQREGLTVLFVTHSIHEAVFLSGRVIVMSARPGTIKGEEQIAFAGERDDEFRISPAFVEHTRRLNTLLSEGPR